MKLIRFASGYSHPIHYAYKGGASSDLVRLACPRRPRPGERPGERPGDLSLSLPLPPDAIAPWPGLGPDHGFGEHCFGPGDGLGDWMRCAPFLSVDILPAGDGRWAPPIRAVLAVDVDDPDPFPDHWSGPHEVVCVPEQDALAVSRAMRMPLLVISGGPNRAVFRA